MQILQRSPLIFRRHFSETSRVVLGIRREDPARVWERRCPLTPDAVHNLIHSSSVDVLIQDCERRAFKTADFVAAGARVHDTLEPAHIILGIKEPPVAEVLTSPVPSPSSPTTRTYLMFSHTIKGQPYNMGLLSKFLSSPTVPNPRLLPRLIDYELLTDAGKRTVGFGWFAGGENSVRVFTRNVLILDSFWSLGIPFSTVASAVGARSSHPVSSMSHTYQFAKLANSHSAYASTSYISGLTYNTGIFPFCRTEYCAVRHSKEPGSFRNRTDRVCNKVSQLLKSILRYIL
jgi:Alanine dehydrogenase/PNT, N-terminal domain